MDELARELYSEWEVDKYLEKAEYVEYVRDAYRVLVETAKMGRLTFYGALPMFNELRERFGDTVSSLIGSITGACSEYEVTRGRPLISAIVVNKETSEPGGGFYGLSAVPYNLCRGTWEEQDVTPPEIVMNKRLEFWLSELQETLDYWGKHEE
jgi:hypothetical protein